MAKKLSEAHISKLKDGRKNYLQAKHGLVCKINEEYEIHADELNYILMRNGKVEGYYPNLELILYSLQELAEKDAMLRSIAKDLHAVWHTVVESREWLRDEVAPLLRKGKRE